MFKITEILKDLLVQEATTAKSSGQYSEPLGYVSKRAWDSNAEFDQIGMEREPGEVVGVEIKTELPLEVDITNTSEVEDTEVIDMDANSASNEFVGDEEAESPLSDEDEDDDMMKILNLLNQSEE